MASKKDEMKDVQPIRNYEKINDMKWSLKRFCGERDYILFLLGINNKKRSCNNGSTSTDFLQFSL
jgi:hypothetical protein